MKQLLVSFAAYEYWANEQLLVPVFVLPETLLHQEMESSFPSIHKTWLHIWDASSIWWQRLHMRNEIVVPSLSFHPSMEDLAKGLLEQNKQWITWLNTITETELEKKLDYKNMKGDPFQQPVKDIVLHVFNHGTYHRGQVVTLLRRLGVTQIPQTDYIVFNRM